MKFLPAVPPEADFRILISSRLMTAVAGAATPVLLIFTLLDRPSGDRELGWVLGVGALPALVVLLFSGLATDRLSRRGLVFTGDLLNALLCAGVGIMLLTGHSLLWFIVAAAVLSAGTQALLYPAYGALLPATVADEHVQEANALRSVITTTSSIAGPTLAAAGSTLAPLWAAWLTAAALFALGGLRVRAVATDGSAPERDDGLLQQIRAGYRYFRAHRWLTVMTAYSAVWHLVVWAPLIVLGAVSMREDYGGAARWGYVETALGVGGLCAGLVIGRLRPRRVLLAAMTGLTLAAAAALAIGLHAPYALVLAAAFLSGAGLCAADVFWSSSLQKRVPSDLLGQILSYDYLVSVALLPIGYALAPFLSDWIGTGTYLVSGMVIAVLGFGVVALEPTVRESVPRDLPMADPVT